MKKIVTISIVVISIVASRQLVFTNASTPPVARTGAPGEITCSGCHGNASGTGGTIDFGGGLTQYELSKTYTVTITGENGTKNGFELVSLRNSDDTNIGTITVTNTTNTTTQLSGGKTYISHKSASSNNTWSFDWTAPLTNEGIITFYFAINKANGDLGSGGDLIYTNSLTITPNVVPPCSTNMYTISTSKTDVLCKGNSDGTATVSITGGTQPYSYKWSNGATTKTISNLSAGNYFVTIADVNGCDTFSTTTLSEPSAISVIMITTSDTKCNKSADGTAFVSTKGGTKPYSYKWSNGETNQTATNLTAGNNFITVTDANGCVKDSMVAISEPSAIAVKTVATSDATCGVNDGTITVSAYGGTPGYNYVWEMGSNDSSVTGLAAGSYTLTVSDVNGCEWIKSYNINNTGAPEVFIVEKINISCNGYNDGNITVSINGGITPYTYLWSDAISQTTLTATGLIADIYNFEVTDSVGCKNIKTITLTEPDKLFISIESIQNITCYGKNDGSVDISVSGGTVPYSYFWSNGSTTEDLSLLTPNKYGITVTDANGCMDSIMVTISEPDSMYFVINFTETDSINFYIIYIDSAFGGTMPFTFKWSDSVTTNDSLAIYASGLFNLTVMDANGCIYITNEVNLPIQEYMQKLNNNSDILIYPNPTSGKVYFYGLNINELLKVNIFDLLGNKFEIEMLVNNKFKFDLNEFNFPSGLYFIEIETKESIIRKKIIFTK